MLERWVLIWLRRLVTVYLTKYGLPEKRTLLLYVWMRNCSRHQIMPVREDTFSTYYTDAHWNSILQKKNAKPQHLNNRGIYSMGNKGMLILSNIMVPFKIVPKYFYMIWENALVFCEEYKNIYIYPNLCWKKNWQEIPKVLKEIFLLGVELELFLPFFLHFVILNHILNSIYLEFEKKWCYFEIFSIHIQ